MTLVKFKFAWALVALTLSSGVIAFLLTEPETQVPVHWNIYGEVDNWAEPAFAFFLLPGIQVLIMLIFAALPLLEPRKDNITKSRKAIHAIILGTVGVMTVAQSAIVAGAFGYDPIGPNSVIAAVGVLIAVMGNYMSKLKSNFFIGVRTPWTLSSDTVWRKTHRRAAKLFIVAGGLIFLGSFFVPGPYLAALLLGTILPITFYVIFYSWRLWQHEKAGPK
ncbi:MULTISPECIES: SdpI family protein [Kordiimonas]|jgi:uncharacterized membrane protein|uniref:SdpI family protein n=1 Tax=Kordiimonas TaxID=288021 RepID=UPI0025800BFA|nr:SdpI family protein [Kordiimonas sp. UBA4487]